MAAWRQSDRKTTTRHWAGYRKYAAQLAKVEPGSVCSLMELGYAEGNLCELAHTDNYDFAEASHRCAESIKYDTAALAKSPGDDKIRQDLANRHGWMARVEMSRGDYGASVESRHREAQLMDDLLNRDPKNVEYAIRRSWASIGLAATSIQLGQPLAARKELRSAIPAFESASALASGDERLAGSRMRLWFYLAMAELLIDGRVSPETGSQITKLRLAFPSLSEIYEKIIEGTR